MFRGKKIIAIIPARSGSKALKDKNILDLNGKPLIAYTIEAARNSGVFDKIFVSTDSEKYAEIAKKFGAEVPFLRSKENSSDKADSWSVVKEVLENLDENFDVVILLQPTSPLRTAQNIKEAINLFIEKEANSVVSVCEFNHPLNIINTLDDKHSLKGFIKREEQNQRRQDAKKNYIINGAIYIIKSELCSDNPDLYGEKSFAYIMDKENSIDIDEKIDLEMAKIYLGEGLL